ncbi:hypothetical protein R1flu_026955 [Riccia fluitans]|uniref:Leucine-rich repeat-containing N-terminal plant-type domain-containing protein n=1 Tax=Riccia fluitans TaxID=41844 RepID=A0ABD1XHF3_9MARC
MNSGVSPELKKVREAGAYSPVDMGSARCLVLLLVLSVATEVVCAQTCNPVHNTALLYFSREIATSGTAFRTWIEGTNCCSWTGVTCDSSGNVISLVVSNSDIPTVSPTGQNYTIASALGNLDSLVAMNISNIGLPGSLSQTLGTLTKLQNMTIDGCNLDGPIPDSFCNLVALKTFVLRNNLLTSYPDCFKKRPSITTLDLTGNKFDANDVPKRP